MILAESDVPWLIFELMEYGDLISILRKIRSQNKVAVQNEKSAGGDESREQPPPILPNVTKARVLTTTLCRALVPAIASFVDIMSGKHKCISFCFLIQIGRASCRERV